MAFMFKVRYLFITVLTAATLVFTQGCGDKNSFSDYETDLIGTDSTAGIMRVLKVNNKQDVTVLRGVSLPFTREDLRSDLFRILKKRMLATVLDTANPGVGIAAPQVGISRRLVAVQRFDKPGEPFEFYANIYVKESSPGKKYGWEGCLSIPDKRDTVLRSEWIIISYTDEATFTEKSDTVSGFTAVIFQHETDHLEGILYTDRTESVKTALPKTDSLKTKPVPNKQ